MKIFVRTIIPVIFLIKVFPEFYIGAEQHQNHLTASSLQGDNPLAKEVCVNKITSILYVENIESCLKFWVDSLGFVKTAEVKDGKSLGFVILASGKVEVMLQTYASLQEDIPDIVNELRGSHSVLYIEVDDAGEIERRLEGFRVVVPRRKTFYGADEIYFRSPGGHIIGFSQHGS